MYREKFAKNLRELLGTKSVRKAALEMGIPPQTLHRYLRCEREIGLEYLVKIADYFDEDLDVLTGRKEF